jgi:hypothetical protein
LERRINPATINPTAPVIPQHYDHIRIAESAYWGTQINGPEQDLLKNSVDLVINDGNANFNQPEPLPTIEGISPNTTQLVYTNVSNLSDGSLLDWLNYADTKGLDRESAFLHTATPTSFSASDAAEPVSWFWGLYTGASDLTQPSALTLQSYNGTDGSVKGGVAFGQAGQAVYMGYHDPFRQIRVDLTTPAGGVWGYNLEYASAVNANGVITGWTTLTPSSDTTNGLTHTGSEGVITFDPPSGWVPGILNNFNEQNANQQNFGPRLYYVRFDINHNGTAPTASSILTTDYVQAGDKTGNDSGTIPFFDANLDTNHDGYLNDNEIYPHGSDLGYARFAYQSRLFYGSALTGDNSYGPGRFATNPADPSFANWTVDYLTRLLNDQVYYLHDGHQYDHQLADGLFVDNSTGKPPTDANTQLAESISNYARDYGELLDRIAVALAPRWVVPNTGAYGTYAEDVIPSTQTYFKEDALEPLKTNWSTFETIATRMAQQNALASGAYTLLSTDTNTLLPLNASNGDKLNLSPDPQALLSTLAEYYLLADPATTFLLLNGSVGGEGNTSWTRHWLTAAAYDVGQPLGTWSLFDDRPDTVAGGSYTENVYQRAYQNALVLYKPLSYDKPDQAGAAAKISDDTAVTYNLNGSYYVLQADGTLLRDSTGNPISVTSVSLRSGQGAILIKAQRPGAVDDFIAPEGGSLGSTTWTTPSGYTGGSVAVDNAGGTGFAKVTDMSNGQTSTAVGVATVAGLLQADVVLDADVTMAINGNAGLLARYTSSTSGFYSATVYRTSTTDYGAEIRYWHYLSDPSSVLVYGVADFNPLLGGNTHHLQFVAQGNTFTLYVDGALVIPPTTDTHLNTAGTVGLWGRIGNTGGTNPLTTVSNFVTSQYSSNSNPTPQQVYFSDDFARKGSIGQPLWKVVSNNGGYFSVSGGQVTVATQAGFSGGSAYVDGLSLTDAVVEADVNPGSSQRAWLLARYNGAAFGSTSEQYYAAALYVTGGNAFAYLYKKQTSGTLTQLASGNAVPLAQAGARLLRLEVTSSVTGSQLRVYVDGVLIASATDNSITGSGYVGILGSDPGVTFDNFQAYGLAQTATPPGAVPAPFSDTFTAPDGAGLDPYSWVGTAGRYKVQSGKAVAQTGTSSTALSTTTLYGVSQTNVAVEADVTVSAVNSEVDLLACYNGLYVPGGTSTESYYEGVLKLVSQTNEPAVYEVELGKKLSTGGAPTVLGSPVIVGTQNQPPAGHLRFEVFEASGVATLLLYVDGVLKASYPDSSPLGVGSVGVSTNAAGDGFDNFSFSTTDLAFRDTFSGSSLNGSTWSFTPGTFTVTNNQATVTSAVGSQASVAGGFNLSNEVVEADVTLPSNNTSAFLLAQLNTPTNTYYAAALSRQSDGTVSGSVGKIVSGSWGSSYNVAAVPLFAAANVTESFHVRLEVLYGTLNLYVDGVAVAAYSDPSPLGSGTVGMSGTNNTSFANFVVHGLTPLRTAYATGYPGLSLDPQQGGFQNTSDLVGNSQFPTGATGIAAANIATASGVSLAQVSIEAWVSNLAASSMVGVLARYQASGSFYAGVLTSDATKSNFSAQLYRYDGGIWTQLASAPVTPTASGQTFMRLEVLGNGLTLFVQGQTAATVQATDDVLTGPGAVGVLASGGNILDAIEVFDPGLDYDTAANRNQPSFSDTFPTPGSSLDGTKWTTSSGSFSVANNQASVSTSLALATTSTTNYALPQDVIVEADLTAPPTIQVFLLARYTPGSLNGCYAVVLYNTGAGNQYTAAIEKVDGNGNPTSLTKEIPVPVLPGANPAQHVRFELVGTMLTLYVNGALIAWATDGTYSGGSAGIEGYQYDTFANVQVRPYDQYVVQDNFPSGLTVSVWPAASQSGGFGPVSGGSGAQGRALSNNVALVANAYAADVAAQATVTLSSNGDVAGLAARYQGPGNFYAGVIAADSHGNDSYQILRYQNGMPTLLATAAAPSGPAALRFEVLGDSLALYAGTALVTWATDDALTGPGQLGILALDLSAAAGDQLTSFNAELIGGPSDPTASRGQPVFQDNFQQADNSSLTASWDVIQGSFAVTKGQAQLTNPGVQPVGMAVWATTPASANVIVETDVRLLNPTQTISGTTYAGLLARYNSGSNSYYRARLYIQSTTPNTIFAEVTKWSGGNPVSSFNQEATTAVAIPLAFTGGPRHLRLEVVDSPVGNSTVTTVSLYVDGTLVVWGTDSSVMPNGQAGIVEDQYWGIDNFQVRTFDTFASDNFTRLDSHPDTSLSPAWVPQSGSFTIVSGTPSQAQGGTPASGTYNIATMNGAAPVNASVSATIILANSAGHRAGLVVRYQAPGDYYAAALVYDVGGYYARIYRVLDGVETLLLSSQSLSSITYTSVVSLRFEVVGTSLALYVNWGLTANTQVQLTVNDDQISGPGSVGIYSSSNDLIGNFVAQFIGGPAASHLTRTATRFQEGFEAPDNTSLANLPNWFVAGGASIDISSGQAEIMQVDSAHSSSYGVAVEDSPTSLGDVVVEAQVVPPSSGNSAGLVLRYSGTDATNDSFYAAMLYNNSGSWDVVLLKKDQGAFDTNNLFSMNNGVLTNITSSTSPVDLRVEMVGLTISVCVNGVEVVSRTDNVPNPTTFPALLTGEVGIRGSQYTLFGDFVVHSIDQVAADVFGPSGNLAPTWTAQYGGFRQVNGQAQGTQSSKNIATMNGPRLANVSVSATLTVANVANHLTGVILRYQDTNDYLTAVIFDSGGAVYVEIVQYVNGNATTLLQPVLLSGVSIGNAVDIRFEALGNQLMLWVNGTLETPQNAPVTTALLGPGLVGMLAYNDSTVDDFSADAL